MPKGQSTKGWKKKSVLYYVPKYEEMCNILPRKKILMWSGGTCSTALALLMMDAGEEFDVCHVSHRWTEEVSMLPPQQLAWQEDMIGVFKEYGCNYWQFDNPETVIDFTFFQYPVNCKDYRYGEALGAILFEQKIGSKRCHYYERYHKIVGKIANLFRKWYKEVYFATLLSEKDLTKTMRSKTDSNRIQPFCLYPVTQEDCEKIIIEHGYKLPPCLRCICCGFFTKEEREEMVKYVPNARELAKEMLSTNPKWIEEKYPVKNSWYADIFGITELDYPKLKYKKIYLSTNNPYITDYNDIDLKKIRRERKEEAMKND